MPLLETSPSPEMVTEPVSSARLAAVRRMLGNEAVALLLAWLILVVVFAFWTPYFWNGANALNIGRAVAVTVVVASGTTIALVAGLIDLSIASVMNLTAVVVGSADSSGIPMWLSVIIGLASGTSVGLVNGLIITKFRINPIIVTLATAGIVQGIAYLVTSGAAEPISSKFLDTLGTSDELGIPVSVWMCTIVALITFLVLRKTVFGRMVYMIGGNPVASSLAGINVDRWRVLFLVASSFSAALAGVLLLAKVGSVIPDAATGTELNIIAAVILGGTSLVGGAGTMQGTVVGVLILGTLTNGMTLLNINAYWQSIAAGVVLILAVAADRLRTGGYR
jgi:ribose transport system permease protein